MRRRLGQEWVKKTFLPHMWLSVFESVTSTRYFSVCLHQVSPPSTTSSVLLSWSFDVITSGRCSSIIFSPCRFPPTPQRYALVSGQPPIPMLPAAASVIPKTQLCPGHLHPQTAWHFHWGPLNPHFLCLESAHLTINSLYSQPFPFSTNPCLFFKIQGKHQFFVKHFQPF